MFEAVGNFHHGGAQSLRRPTFLVSGVHTECSEPETVVEFTARVVAEPKALVEFRAWEAQSLRLSQNWRLIAARETAVEFYGRSHCRA